MFAFSPTKKTKTYFCLRWLRARLLFRPQAEAGLCSSECCVSMFSGQVLRLKEMFQLNDKRYSKLSRIFTWYINSITVKRHILQPNACWLNLVICEPSIHLKLFSYLPNSCQSETMNQHIDLNVTSPCYLWSSVLDFPMYSGIPTTHQFLYNWVWEDNNATKVRQRHGDKGSLFLWQCCTNALIGCITSTLSIKSEFHFHLL